MHAICVESGYVGLQTDAVIWVEYGYVGLQTNACDLCRIRICRFTNRCMRSDAVIWVEYRYVGLQTDACVPML